MNSKEVKVIDDPNHFGRYQVHLRYLLSILPEAYRKNINKICFVSSEENETGQGGFVLTDKTDRIVKTISGIDFVVSTDQSLMHSDAIDSLIFNEICRIVYDKFSDEWKSRFMKNISARLPPEGQFAGQGFDRDSLAGTYFAGMSGSYIMDSRNFLNYNPEMGPTMDRTMILQSFMKPDKDGKAILTYYTNEDGIPKQFNIKLARSVEESDFSYVRSMIYNDMIRENNIRSVREWFSADILHCNGIFNVASGVAEIEHYCPEPIKIIDTLLDSSEISQADKSRLNLLKKDFEKFKEDSALLKDFADTKGYRNIAFTISPAVVDMHDMPTLLDAIKTALNNTEYSKLARLEISITIASSNSLHVCIDPGNQPITFTCDIKQLSYKLEEAVREKTRPFRKETPPKAPFGKKPMIVVAPIPEP